MTFHWQTPAWRTSWGRANRVELLRLRERDIIPEVGWPARFWNHVADRRTLSGADAQEAIRLFG